MAIYVSGPYAPPSDVPECKKKIIIKKNIDNARKVGLEIQEKGHTPLIPHTMMCGWQDKYDVSQERVLELSKELLERCDAIFIMKTPTGHESKGMKIERERAEELELKIYRNIDEIEEGSYIPVRPATIKAKLTEYEQCMECYRHTYATIWQAGALFTAISALMVPLMGSINTSNNASEISRFILVIAPLPFLFWVLGIFWPMNAYAEKRAKLLANMEQWLNKRLPGLKMEHFREYNEMRRKPLRERKRLRVHQVVYFFAFLVLSLELYLVGVHCLSPFIEFIKKFLSRYPFCGT